MSVLLKKTDLRLWNGNIFHAIWFTKVDTTTCCTHLPCRKLYFTLHKLMPSRRQRAMHVVRQRIFVS